MARWVAIAIALISVNALAHNEELKRIDSKSIQIASKMLSKSDIDNLVLVETESRHFMVSSGQFSSYDKATYVDTRTEERREPDGDAKAGIEKRMAELASRSRGLDHAYIYKYKSYVVTSGLRDKFTEGFYESYSPVRKNP